MTKTNKFDLPDICRVPQMTPEEIEQSTEDALDREREWLDRYEEQQKQRKARQPIIESRLLRTKQAAHYLGISEWKLRQMVYDCELEVVRDKYWKFDRVTLDRWIECHKEKGHE